MIYIFYYYIHSRQSMAQHPFAQRGLYQASSQPQPGGVYYAHQLGQPMPVVYVQQPPSISALCGMQYAVSFQHSSPTHQSVPPTGMVYTGILHLSNWPTHVRSAPYNNCPVEQVLFPTPSVRVTVDPRFPTWVHITCSNGVGGTINGWVGKQHVF